MYWKPSLITRNCNVLDIDFCNLLLSNHKFFVNSFPFFIDTMFSIDKRNFFSDYFMIFKLWSSIKATRCSQVFPMYELKTPFKVFIFRVQTLFSAYCINIHTHTIWWCKKKKYKIKNLMANNNNKWVYNDEFIPKMKVKWASNHACKGHRI